MAEECKDKEESKKSRDGESNMATLAKEKEKQKTKKDRMDQEVEKEKEKQITKKDQMDQEVEKEKEKQKIENDRMDQEVETLKADKKQESELKLDCIFDDSSLGFERATNEEHKLESQDPLEEINLGTVENKKVTYISKLLQGKMRGELIRVLHEYKDYFAWDYDEILGLDRGLVENRLPMIPGKKPVKQSPRRFAPKNGKLKVCIDFRDLNTATPKDEYPMPIAETMIDVVAGFVIHQKGIEVDRNKTKAIMETRPPSNKKELQSLLGKVKFLRRFISNLSGKTKLFSPLLRLKKEEEFRWDEEHQKAFDEIKAYLAHPPVLAPPSKGKQLKLYISVRFGVTAGDFLGFVIHQKGIEVDKNKTKVIMETTPPSNKKELQSL
ncbi:uncharacterized protein LOC109813635 [Cajanus cajan]|uniref:uncharacterized protein LOC109813635 n=1 Tax=Cajanus cajan TaxID=3821 RepID=UPI00098D8C84|nr:uncharacterized protein LOC109813635 [Cajanus cajan]